MSDCSSSVTKYIIVEASPQSGSYSGLTVCGGGGLTVDFITGCTSDGVNVSGGIFNNGVLTIPTINATTFSGGTYYGDGSNLIGISSVDSYMTGGTYSNGFITFSGNGNFSNVTVDVSALIDDTNYYVTGSTLNGNTLELGRNGGLPTLTTDLSSINTDNYVSGGTYSNGNLFFSGTSNNQTFSIDVSALIDDTNSYVTGGTVSGTNLILGRNGGLPNVTIDTSAYFDNTDNYVTGGTMVGNTLVLNRTDALSAVTVDLSQFVDTINDTYVTGSTLSGNTLILGRNQGLVDLTTDLSSINTDTYVTGTTLSGNQAIVTRNDGQEIFKLSGGTAVTLSNPSTNLIKIDVDASSDNFYVTGGTVSGTNLLLGRSGGLPNVTIDTSAYFDNTDNYVTGGTMVGNTLVLNRTDALSAVTVDMSQFIDDTNFYVTGQTLNGTILETSRNGGLSTLSTDFLPILSGFTSTDYYVTGATMNGNTLELGRNGLPDVTVNLSQFVDSDTSVTGLTYNPTTYDLTLSQDNGKPSYVSNLAALASDIFVLSGVYDISTGIVTYTTNSGTTFQVSGFTSGMTDSYTSSANLNGNEIQFNNNIQGTNLYNVDLTPLLSGKTNNTDFWSHTGDTNNPHQTSFSNLTSTGHTHTLSEITDFSSYSGSVQTQIDSKVDNSTFTSYTASTQSVLDSKVDSSTFTSYTANTQNILNTKIDGGINVGGGHEIFSGITGTDMNFRTLSGGSNTTLTTIGDVVKIDVTIPSDVNTYVTGFTIDTNQLILTQNDGTSGFTVDLSPYIDNTDNYVTGGTMVGNTLVLNRTNALSAVTVDMSQFVDDTNFYVTGFTYNNSNQLTLGRNGGLSDLSVFINEMTGLTVNGNISGTTFYGDGSNLTGIVHTTDTFVSGGTYSTGNLFFSGNSSDTSFIVDVSALLDDTNSYVTGGTYNDTTNNINFSGNSLETTFDVDLTNLVSSVSGDTYVVGGTYVDSTNTIALLRNDGNFVTVTGVSNTYVTGSTLNGNILELSRNGGLSTLTTDLSTLNPSTTLDRKLFIPAAMASTMGSSILTYHGTTGVALLSFGGGNPDNDQGSFPMVVPQDYVSGGTFEIIYTSQSTINDMVWSFGINNASNGVDFSTFTESGPHMDLVVSGQTFLNRGTSQIMTPTGTTFNAYDAVTVRVNRDASDSRDTANNITGYIYGLIFNYKANN